MNRSHLLFLPLASLLWLASCQPNGQSQPNVPVNKTEKLAQALCECSGKLAQMNETASKISPKHISQDSINVIFRSLQDEFNRSKECLSAAIAQYGKLKPDEYESLEQQLKFTCPSLAGKKDFVQEMLGE